MNKGLKISGILLMVLMLLYGYRRWTTHSFRASVDETRRQLREQDFKTDLSDFDFASPAEINARADTIIAAGQAVRSLRHARELQFMEWVGTNVAMAISHVAIIETHTTTNLWPLVQDELAAHDKTLDSVCASLVMGPVKFQPLIKPGGDILVPYLVDHKTLARALAVRAVIAMHQDNTNVVFTNILAVSRMVTGWTPEPFEVAHVVRFACAGIAQQVIWEWMQTDHCNEAGLAALQREWESVKFFDGLAATAELSCASMVGMCQATRSQSYSVNIGGWGSVLRGIPSSPADGLRNLWQAIRGYRQHVHYQNNGSYEDEKALLLYYRDRSEELKRALQCSSWSEMRSVPGATNIVVFRGAKVSRIGPRMNLKQLTAGFHAQGRSLMAGAAEAEVRRRLIVTAIALKRFALRHEVYPQSLRELVPAFVPNIPVDFMDGKGLRYGRHEDGRYLLYSVGLDCVDDGGTTPNLPRRFSGEAMGFLPITGADLVWPLSATQADVDAFESEEERKRSLDRARFPETLDNNPDGVAPAGRAENAE